MTFHQARLRKALGFPSVMDALAWDIATAVSDFPVETNLVPSLVIERVIDTAALAALALGQGRGGTARNRALLHPSLSGASMFGAPTACRVAPEWAAWTNGVMVREASGCHDALAAGYPYPGDVIPPLMAVAQSHGCRGADLIRGIAIGYDVQAALAARVAADKPPIDHIAPLGAAVAAGIAAMLRLSLSLSYGMIRQVLRRCDAIRRSRKRKILGWQDHVQARIGKVAVEALHSVRPGDPRLSSEGTRLSFFDAPWEGMWGRGLVGLHGSGAVHWGVIALARQLGPRIGNFEWVDGVFLHAPVGAADDDVLARVLAVALQDRGWQHERACAPGRSSRPDTLALSRKVRVVRHCQPIAGKVVAMLKGGAVLQEELEGGGDVAAKFRALSEGIISRTEQDGFLAAAYDLPELEAGDIARLTF